MRLKLYCNRYGHFKDALVCSVNCVYRVRCQDFALFYDEQRAEVDAVVAGYFAARRESDRAPAAPERTLPNAPTAAATPIDMRALISLEVKKEMAEALYIWIDKEDRAELVSTEEVLRRAERGAKAKNIYKVAQEMELRFQLVPRKRIEKAKRAAAAEAERAAARRTRVTTAKTPTLSLASALSDDALDEPLTTPTGSAAAGPRRRARSRTAKVAGER